MGHRTEHAAIDAGRRTLADGGRDVRCCAARPHCVLGDVIRRRWSGPGPATRHPTPRRRHGEATRSDHREARSSITQKYGPEVSHSE